jgi:hypothetical protein
LIVETAAKKQFMDEFKSQWKCMWRNRLDDRVRAEGVADRDYSLLSVDRGTVIIATRKFKLLDFREILQQRDLSNVGQILPLDPSVGGWGKFVRTNLVVQNPRRRRGQALLEPDRSVNQQLKKGGRGWLHIKR